MCALRPLPTLPIRGCHRFFHQGKTKNYRWKMSHFLFDRCRSHWNHPVSALHIHQVSCWFQNLLEKIVWKRDPNYIF